MAKTTADVLFERLIDWGVDIDLRPARRRHQRHHGGAADAPGERSASSRCGTRRAAAFVACGYAKFTGRLGVCIATCGPGAIHLLNGLYDAKMDGAPVLAITGQTYHDLIGTHYQQEVDLLGLFEDVAVFNQQIIGPEHAHGLVDAACRAALSRRGRRAPQLPATTGRSSRPDEEPSTMKVKGHTSDGLDAADRGAAGGVAQERPRRCSTPARRPSSWPARGRCGAGDELEQAGRHAGGADRQGAAGQGRRARRLARTPPAGIGLLGTAPFREGDGGVRHAADGRHELPLHGVPARSPARRKAVQIDRDPTRIGLRYPDRRRPVPATPRRRSRPCCRCSSAGRTARSWRRPRSG